MKKEMNGYKKFAFSFVCQVILYVLHYLIIPLVYVPKPYDEKASYMILGISTLIIVVIGQSLLVKKTLSWIISLPIYSILVLIYHPKEIYGIGYRGHSLINVTEIDVLVWTIFLLGIEIFSCVLVNALIYLRIKDKKK